MAMSRARAKAALVCSLLSATLAFANTPVAAATFYVTRVGDAIDKVDSTTNTVTGTLPSYGDFYLAVSPDGSRVITLSYTNLVVANTASNTRTLVPLADGPYFGPFFAVSADFKTLYLQVNASGGNPISHLRMINVATGAVLKDVPQASVYQPTLTADGKKLLGLNSTGVMIYDSATLTQLATVPLPAYANRIGISPVQPRAYVVNYSGLFGVIDTQNNTLMSTTTIPANPQPYYLDQGVAVSPDGRWVYVTRLNSIAVFDTEKNAVTTIPIPQNMGQVIATAFTPDSKYAYVLTEVGEISGWVQVVDTASQTIVSTISVDGGVFIATNGAPLTTYAPPTVPFAKFTPQLMVAPKLSAYSVAASFTPGKSAAALSPTTQDLTLTVGTFTVKVPAGSIKQPSPKIGVYTYNGVINGAAFGLILIGSGTGPWGIVAVGSHSFGTLPGTLPVTLAIGGNSGTTSTPPVTATKVQSLTN